MVKKGRKGRRGEAKGLKGARKVGWRGRKRRRRREKKEKKKKEKKKRRKRTKEVEERQHHNPKTTCKPTSDFLGHPEPSGGLQGPGLVAVSEEEGAVVGPLAVGRVLAARPALAVFGQQ